ncbi:hypothetical protein C500_00122 [Natrialba magadii ATCC 43099]|uniref:Uncharacterized protein n=1 Tax=Natrialba magadii (strain ATCC 43099 / DSM 3394 / CCM 3739 / CIP 104546 / IAM 13178 / JCM 8861 / NBRC 102185 / NCIMB 2190 / MS3) TaxID=547559 RepID=L9VC35_NATMM|nr:hypothetical protein C500_00122 [Natrialba magadii ATCC 43099]
MNIVQSRFDGIDAITISLTLPFVFAFPLTFAFVQITLDVSRLASVSPRCGECSVPHRLVLEALEIGEQLLRDGTSDLA